MAWSWTGHAASLSFSNWIAAMPSPKKKTKMKWFRFHSDPHDSATIGAVGERSLVRELSGKIQGGSSRL